MQYTEMGFRLNGSYVVSVSYIVHNTVYWNNMVCLAAHFVYIPSESSEKRFGLLSGIEIYRAQLRIVFGLCVSPVTAT